MDQNIQYKNCLEGYYCFKLLNLSTFLELGIRIYVKGFMQDHVDLSLTTSAKQHLAPAIANVRYAVYVDLFNMKAMLFLIAHY